MNKLLLLILSIAFSMSAQQGSQGWMTDKDKNSVAYLASKSFDKQFPFLEQKHDESPFKKKMALELLGAIHQSFIPDIVEKINEKELSDSTALRMIDILVDRYSIGYCALVVSEASNQILKNLDDAQLRDVYCKRIVARIMNQVSLQLYQNPPQFCLEKCLLEHGKLVEVERRKLDLENAEQWQGEVEHLLYRAKL